MKKIINTGLSLLAVLMMFSCDDFLDTTSPSEFTPDVVYGSTTYTEYALMGCYALHTQDQSYSSRMSLTYPENSDIEFAGANQSSYNEDTNRGLSNYMGTPSNNRVVDEWALQYRIIERCNLAIKGIEESPVMKGSDRAAIRKMNALYGEAMTLRALAYFELVRNWGDVPYKREPTKEDLSNASVPATDRDLIMEGIIDDLLLVSNGDFLYWIGEGGYTSPERVTTGFAKGLAARIALFRGGYSIRNKAGFPTERGSDWEKYYKIADQQCAEIIEKEGVKHKLTSSAENFWKGMCALQVESLPTESLFEIGFGLGRSGEIGYSIGVRFAVSSTYGYSNNSNLASTSHYYFYSFDSLDVRRDLTVATYKVAGGDNNTPAKEQMNANLFDLTFAKWDQRWMNDQFKNQNKAASNKFGYGVNWPIMRYADVLLMYAETQSQLPEGNLETGKAQLEKVRKRAFATKDQPEKVSAYMAAINSKDKLFQAIVNERAWEFGGEGLRKYDLVRWNLLQAKIEEQRTAIINMLNGKYPVTIFDKTYNFLPQYVYYKYQDGSTEFIDKSSINYYSDRGSDAISGYTKQNWLSGISKGTTFDNYILTAQRFSSGLKKEVNGACDNRHLFPIGNKTITDSNGILKNAYGF